MNAQSQQQLREDAQGQHLIEIQNASYQKDQRSEIVPVTRTQAGGLLKGYETVMIKVNMWKGEISLNEKSSFLSNFIFSF